MEWQLALLVIGCVLVILMAAGMPVAFTFVLLNVVAAILFWGGGVGIEQFVITMKSSVQHFTFLPVPLFVLMGEVAFQTGIAPRMIDALDKWLGGLPGRLSLLAVASGTMLATLTGTSLASAALLGSILVPEMEKRGYHKTMALGPCMGSGCLAMMIPPAALTVIMGSLAEISIGRLLLAIIVPGLLMATFYATYIVLRCLLQPHLAPRYEVAPTPLYEKMMSLVKHVLPLAIIIFLVTGIIFLGVATPTEAAATGTLGCFILAAAYGKLTWEVVKKSVASTTVITVMLFMIIVGATAFARNLAYIGATRGVIEFVTTLPVSPIIILIGMQVLLVIMGAFMEIVSIMMLTIPLFMPVVHMLGFNEVWFGVIFLINIAIAEISPPFGMVLFVMKGVAPADTTMGEIYKSVIPFLLCDIIVMALVIVFPLIALWLPGLMP